VELAPNVWHPRSKAQRVTTRHDKRKTLFDVATLLSIVLLAILPLGYAGSFGVRFTHHTAVGTFRFVSLELDRGRVAFWWQFETLASLPPGFASTIPTGSHLSGIARPRLPSARDWQRALWEFDAHVLRGSSLAPGTSIAPGAWVLLLACPIWCVGLALAILPTIWWTRRRTRSRSRSQRAQGFAVIGTAPSHALDANRIPD
jgi:hypothetical protein